jgi:hypothetical protein
VLRAPHRERSVVALPDDERRLRGYSSFASRFQRRSTRALARPRRASIPTSEGRG